MEYPWNIATSVWLTSKSLAAKNASCSGFLPYASGPTYFSIIPSLYPYTYVYNVYNVRIYNIYIYTYIHMVLKTYILLHVHMVGLRGVAIHVWWLNYHSPPVFPLDIFPKHCPLKS